jgi:hypothetical protein
MLFLIHLEKAQINKQILKYQTNCNTSFTMNKSIECPICYDEITNVNCVTTECCHTFHASCLFKNMNNNVDCPLCRKELVETKDDDEDSDEDSEEYEDDSNDGSYTDDEDDLPQKKFTITQIMVELKKQNISEKQIVATLLQYYFESSFLESHFEYTPSNEDECYEITNRIKDLMFGEIPVDQRDTRTYADVVKGIIAKTERGIGPNIVAL